MLGLSETETRREFSRAEVCGKGLTVVAHYEERKVNAAEVGLCREVHLESGEVR